MANAYLNTTDVLTFRDSNMDGVISDVLDRAPIVQQMAARSAPGHLFKYTKKTANPAVGFRAVNDGLENTKTTTSQVTVTLAVLDATWRVDVAVADADPRGREAHLAFEEEQHLREAFFHLEEQIFYGTGNDSAGFSGLANQTNLDDSDDAQVVNAGGTTANTGSSAFLIRTGEMDTQIVYGNNGMIEVRDPTIVDTAGSVTGTFPAYYRPIVAWTGLKIGSIYSVVRIANLTEDSGKGLTDDLIASALSEFPSAAGPTLIAMNRRSLKQLQQSRTATNATGAPAPFPAEAFGVPIVVTDAISSTEALLTPA